MRPQGMEERVRGAGEQEILDSRIKHLQSIRRADRLLNNPEVMRLLDDYRRMDGRIQKGQHASR